MRLPWRTSLSRTPSDRSFIVLEGPPGCSESDSARLRRLGCEILDGFPGRGVSGRRSFCHAVITSAEDAVGALLAALDGHGLLVEARADRAVVDRLIEDLRRLGPVDHRIVGGAAADAIDQEGLAILALLAEGHSLGEAALELCMSRRTADRRLAEARRALGVERTTEAVARARRLGWLGPG